MNTTNGGTVRVISARNEDHLLAAREMELARARSLAAEARIVNRAYAAQDLREAVERLAVATALGSTEATIDAAELAIEDAQDRVNAVAPESWWTVTLRPWPIRRLAEVRS